MAYPVWEWPKSMIIRVVDGDSFVAQLMRDMGFHGTVTFQQRLRLNRINAPDIKTVRGMEAKTAFLSMVKPSMTYVYIETVKPYKYGDEWMAEVTLEDGSNVSDELVKAGLAVYWDGSGLRPE